jgi:hypothetical protein
MTRVWGILRNQEAWIGNQREGGPNRLLTIGVSLGGVCVRVPAARADEKLLDA